MIASKQSSAVNNNRIMNGPSHEDMQQVQGLPAGTAVYSPDIDDDDDEGDNISIKSNYSVISRMSADEQTKYVRSKRAALQDSLKNQYVEC